MEHKFGKFFTAALGAAVLAATHGLPGDATAQTNATHAATNASSAASPPVKLDELFGDPVIARGKGIEVKRSQLDSAIISMKSAAAAQRQIIPPEKMDQVEQQILERLIQVEILRSKATGADRAKGKALSEKQLAGYKASAGSDEALNRQLKSAGLTQEELRIKLAEEATAQAVVERELTVNVTDEDAKKFYEENPAEFEEPEKVRASHILLATVDTVTHAPLSDDQQKAKRKTIEELLKRARAGEDFAKLAREYSEAPTAKEDGGVLTFARGTMPDTQEFEAAAFSLTNNQVSDVVTTRLGYHIIKLNEKIPASKVELAKVADKVKEWLKQQRLLKLFPDYIKKQEREAGIQILDEKLKPTEDFLAEPAAPVIPEKAGQPKDGEKK